MKVDSSSMLAHSIYQTTQYPAWFTKFSVKFSLKAKPLLKSIDSLWKLLSTSHFWWTQLHPELFWHLFNGEVDIHKDNFPFIPCTWKHTSLYIIAILKTSTKRKKKMSQWNLSPCIAKLTTSNTFSCILHKIWHNIITTYKSTQFTFDSPLWVKYHSLI